MKEKVLSAGKGALLLTVLGAASQLLGFAYRVVMSRLVGAQVMGLYQLILPVQSVLLSLSAVGMVSAVSNLTAQHLALGNSRAASQTVGTCLRMFVCALVPLGALVIVNSDFISVKYLGDARTQLGLILLVPCVALTGIENIHKHFFYGAGLVGTPAIVDLLEQLIRAVSVLTLLFIFLPQYPERVVGLIVGGMVICEIFSSVTLVILYRRRLRRTKLTGQGEGGGVRRRRILSIATPVAGNAVLSNLMASANAALIPQKLVEGGLERAAAVSQFGIVCGMTMPMLTLPTVFLGALNLILVPRLARSHALGRKKEIRRLANRAISAVAVLALPSMALMTVLGGELGRLLFAQRAVGEHLPMLAATVALSCYCSVLCSILNGIERQGTVAGISLVGSGFQLALTLALVPLAGVGMRGYVLAGLLATLLEVVLCLAFVMRYTGISLQLFQGLVAPALASLLSALTGNLLFHKLQDSGVGAVFSIFLVTTFSAFLYLVTLSTQGVRLREVLHVNW